jgi:hypothetical protein
MAALQRFPILRVSLPPDEAWTTLEWRAFSSDYTLSGSGTSPLAELPAAAELEILLPACRVSMHTLELPERAGKLLDALIRQALEDRLLGDRADALAVPGSAQGAERPVWVCSRRWLEAALERLGAAGRRAERLIPEYLLLPESGGATVHAAASGGTIFRAASGQFGIAGNEEALSRLAGGEALQRVEELASRPCPSDCRTGLPAALTRFAGRRFDPRPLYRTAALLAASLALALLATVLQWRQLEKRAARLQHEIRQTFAAAYPGTPIVDPVLQWESLQRESMRTDDALDAAVGVAARLAIPLRPRAIEIGEGGMRLTLTDSDAAQYRAQLEAFGKPERMPAGTGLTQFIYPLAREKR